MGKIWLIVILFVGALGLGLYFVRPSPQNYPVSVPTAEKEKDADLSALEKYCKEEVLKLPVAPFTYDSKEGPRTSGAMPWISQFMPEDRRINQHKSCSMAYSFNGKIAYGEMGQNYPMYTDKFNAAVVSRLSTKIGPPWERVYGDNIKDGAFPMVYRRENTQMGTVDFIDVFSGGLTLYLKINTYYK
ncbi:hypothetical protein A2872_02450 [Candidatus Gottesmanbacteria bacterium RIFCSPHIGHO2_01_FULL_42_12]|uniref:Uncharacterized protein n=1 Tax=Candidatus Gottesmanbacteria bacterium RIFCSPHIGHO2_01_FULL_42_12 TaxID=1798377 RepID=A0A1F5Z4R2_9BACT|nr:MAG: hypothetical protein A2872_02450 [Candidatus Gottesmanbacteria bacterium RIFCSPHIGHO2_01_FULL_42_12]